MTARYSIDSNSSFYGLKASFNSFLDELSNVEIRQLLQNPTILTSNGTSSPNWTTVGLSALTYNSTLQYNSLNLAAGGYLSQNISSELQPNSSYTAVITASVPVANVIKFSVDAGTSNQIFNLDDMTQVNQSTAMLTENTLVKTIVRFSTNATSVANDITLSLTNISDSSVNGIHLTTFTLYKGLVDLSGIIATVVQNDSLLAGRGLEKVDTVDQSGNKIFNVLVSGTTNQIDVTTPNNTYIKLGLPQNIHTDADVQFGTIKSDTVSANTFNKVKLQSALASATLNVNATSVTISGSNCVISGNNSGDQNIVLTGNVSGSGTGNIVTTIADTVITAKKLTGYFTSTATASTPVNATDTLLSAITKLQNSIDNANNEKWPVGSIYTNVNNPANPGGPTMIGYGTWIPFGEGRVIIGAGSAGGTQYTATVSGGEKEHTLTVTEMPPHTHTQTTNGSTAGAEGNNHQDWTGTDTITTGSTGGGQPHNNMQPYVVAYMWWRTA